MTLQNSVRCQICNEQKELSEVRPAELVRQPIVDIIRKTRPDWSTSGFICNSDLNHFRTEYVRNVLEIEKGELSLLEEQVVKSLKEQELLSQNINIEFDRQLTFGERLADRISEFGGSWSFIIFFTSFLFLWILANTIILMLGRFDPYPFILLNLVLSALAAIQAPVIMMSQNRQESKERVRGEHDYRINLKAELEIRLINEKIDHLIIHQWQRLLEIQEIQIDLMEKFVSKTPRENQG